MPYNLTGTLTAFFIYGILFNIFQLILPPPPALAQMDELTEIQNGVFFLSHNDMGITSETFQTDKYIDEEQARYFSDISRPAPNTPADGNYPFTLVDHYILDSDLEIEYHYDSILCSAYQQTAYLSRHNISVADYTDKKLPPVYSIKKISGTDPFTGEKVTAMHLEVRNYENTANEILQKAPKTNQFGINDPSGAEYIRGYVGNTYVRVNSAQIAVWVRQSDTDLMKRCNPPVECTKCLHPSDARQQPAPIPLIRMSFDNPGTCESYLPEPPKCKCLYPPPPERTTPAATNCYSIRNGSSDASSTRGNQQADASDSGSSCSTCR